MNNSKIICAVDPGKDGAICLIRENKELIKLSIMPTVMVGSKKKKRREYDIPTIVSLIRQADECVIEKVHSMPKQGVASMFSFGAGYGLIIGIAAGNDKPYTLIHSRTWKANMLRDMSKDKNASVIRAKQLCPDINLLPTERCYTPHEGMAEAYLLARYYLTEIEPF